MAALKRVWSWEELQRWWGMGEGDYRIEGPTEYSGIQRCGKSTMITKDIVTKILPAGYRPQDIWCNFRVLIEGVNCVSTGELIRTMFRVKSMKSRRVVFAFDEVGQFFMARDSRNKEQSEACAFAWQMPKRDIPFLYGSNIGNSADVILRDATWVTVLPRYHKGQDHHDDYIDAWVSYNYDGQFVKNIICPEVWRWQELFDSYEAIE